MKRYWSLILLMIMSFSALAELTPQFRIASVSVLGENNMTFRVFGMPAMTSCPGSAFAYVDESDSASKTKISTLLSAFAAGKNVQLHVEPVNYLNNGTNYCQIRDFQVF